MSVKVKNNNVSSILLSDTENAALFNMIGRGCVTMASGVCQLYTADAPGRQRWNKKFCGVVCFIKDNPKRSYFIRLYDIKKDGIIWEQEIYNQFKYKAPREYFHTFEADDVQAGINFASEDEAIKFKNAVEQKLLERHQKKMERKKQQGSGMTQSPPAVPPSINAAPAQGPVTNVEIKSGSAPVGKSKGGKNNKKKKLTKEDISTPTAFRHVSHVGWDPTKGFDMNNLDTDMKSLFEQVGISNTTDIDKETVDFIYDFVEQHGGIQKIKEQMNQKPPPPPPQHNVPHHPPPPRSVGPPPPPTRDRGPPPPQRGGPPPPPSRSNQPPPPAPARLMGTPPAPPSFSAPPKPPSQSSKGAPPPAPGPGVPPPPPPPAPPAAPPPPPAAPMAPAYPSGGAGRGALLDSIRSGTQLTKVGVNAVKGGGGNEPASRDNLLESIRSGKTLNKVERDEKSSSDDGQGIVGALAMALANRQKILQMSEDEDEDSSVDDDDEWDD